MFVTRLWSTFFVTFRDQKRPCVEGFPMGFQGFRKPPSEHEGLVAYVAPPYSMAVDDFLSPSELWQLQ